MAPQGAVKSLWRVILSGNSSPYTNMAQDEALFLSFCKNESLPIFRIYGWMPAGFSFGFPQDIKEFLNIKECQKQNIPYVRRMTGGSVIYHKNDISYSVICKKDDLAIKGTIADSYRVVSLFLVNAYKKMGLGAKFSMQNKNEEVSGFCSAVHESYDVTIGGKKIGGSAQRRRRDIIFQHGSIPLESVCRVLEKFSMQNISSVFNGSVSLNMVLGRSILYEEVEDLLQKSFQETYHVNLEKSSFLAPEVKLISYLEENKYLTSAWNLEKHDPTRNTKETILA